jgi:hypothetical protein
MKSYFTAITIFLLSFYSSSAQSLFHGPIRLKGEIKKSHFSSRDFDIKLEGLKFKISRPEKGGKEFLVKFNKSSIRDIVFSSSKTAIAVAMDNSKWGGTQMALVTVDAAGKKRVFKYQSRKMTEGLGWIVELGAVSDNGKLILAKCARMLPIDENGSRFVRHDWVVLEVSNGSIKVVDSMNAIDKWANYVSAQR